MSLESRLCRIDTFWWTYPLAKNQYYVEFVHYDEYTLELRTKTKNQDYVELMRFYKHTLVLRIKTTVESTQLDNWDRSHS